MTQMATTEWASALLMLPDAVLAELYSMWSEQMWAAGWMSNEEEEFARWLLTLPIPATSPARELSDYEVAGIAKMRAVLSAAQ